jgi:hypothetical protein
MNVNKDKAVEDPYFYYRCLPTIIAFGTVSGILIVNHIHISASNFNQEDLSNHAQKIMVNIVPHFTNVASIHGSISPALLEHTTIVNPRITQHSYNTEATSTLEDQRFVRDNIVNSFNINALFSHYKATHNHSVNNNILTGLERAMFNLAYVHMITKDYVISDAVYVSVLDDLAILKKKATFGENKELICQLIATVKTSKIMQTQHLSLVESPEFCRSMVLFIVFSYAVFKYHRKLCLQTALSITMPKRYYSRLQNRNVQYFYIRGSKKPLT